MALVSDIKQTTSPTFKIGEGVLSVPSAASVSGTNTGDNPLTLDIGRYGFLGTPETSISFDNADTFTLTSLGANWSYYRTSIKHTITGNKSKVLATPMVDNTLYYIYIDSTDGELISSTNGWTLNDTKVPVATVYWQSALTPKFIMADERHTCLIDRRWHREHHYAEGVQVASGGTIGTVVLNSTTSVDKVFSIAESRIFDEDLSFTLAELTEPNGATAVYYIFYRTSVTAGAVPAKWDWVASDMPFKYAVLSGTPTYDEAEWDNAGTTQAATANNYINTYLLLCNSVNNTETFPNSTAGTRFMIVEGRVNGNSTAAYAETFASLDMSGLPVTEAVAVYQLTWRCNEANSVKGRCTLNRVQKISTNIVQTTTSLYYDHNSSGGLQGGTMGEYFHLTAAQHTIATQAATASLDGYATSTQITKLDGIEAGANDYTHPTGDGNLHVPANSTTNEGKVLTAGATAGSYTWEEGSSGSGVSKEIHQDTHGFVVGNLVYLNSTVYTKAIADAIATAEVVGIVSAVAAGTDDFTLSGGGYVSGLSGLTAGAVYFLSDTTAGAMTATEPTTEGHISKPIFIADTTTSGYFFNMRGAVIGGGASSYITTFENADLSTGVLTVTHNFGHQYCGQPTIIDNNGLVVIPDEITYTSTTAMAVDISSQGTITGTWRVVVLDSGASTAYDTVSNTVYGSSWDGVTDKAPSKNAVYDQMELKANITPSYYGVSWDESADTYARTGDNAGLLVGVTLGNTRLPIQANMKRCLLADDGTVNHYLDPLNSALLAEGGASDLTGADGQVMVEIPKFWYKHTYVGTVHTWEVSTVVRTGFDVHPAFLSGVTEYDYIYIGAYEGILYDVSTSLYDSYGTGDVIDFTATTGDKLSSVTGKKPVTNGTRAQFRAIAKNRGTGWSQELFDYRSAIQLLYLTEYASFNSQSKIGAGISNVTDWAGYSYYPFAPSGNSNSIGNATGNTAGGTGYVAEASKYMSYRGIENFYGHIWKWLDGINVFESGGNHRAYVCNVLANLADDTTANYTDTGVNIKADEGYQNTLINISRGFLPAVGTDADAATKITDYYWQTTGWAVAISGGDAINGANDGCFCLAVGSVAAYSNANFGSRVCFRG